MIIAIGDKTTKKTKPMTIGETMEPRSIPNLDQSLFSGVRCLDLINPKNKNIKEIIIDQILIDSLLRRGQIPASRNTRKKVMPKLRFELILISCFFSIF